MWRRWRLWFSLFIASHESGQQQLEIQQTQRANISTLAHHWSRWIAMEVIVGGSIDITFATVKLRIYTCVPSTLSLYLIRDRMQMNWLKYSYSMHFFLLSLILFQVLVFFFFFFSPRIFSYLGNVVNERKKKKNIIWFYRIVFRIKNATRIVQFYELQRPRFLESLVFFLFFSPSLPSSCKIELM